MQTFTKHMRVAYLVAWPSSLGDCPKPSSLGDCLKPSSLGDCLRPSSLGDCLRPSSLGDFLRPKVDRLKLLLKRFFLFNRN